MGRIGNFRGSPCSCVATRPAACAVVRGAVSMSGTGRADDARSALLTRLEPHLLVWRISVFDSAQPRCRGYRTLHAWCTSRTSRCRNGCRQIPQHWHALALAGDRQTRSAFIALEDAACCRPGAWPVAW